VESHGGAVLTGTTARVLVTAGRVEAVESEGQRWMAAAVISAVPWFAVADLFQPPPPELAVVLSRAAATASSPIVTVNLWFDRPVLDDPFVGLPGRDMQWVFDKRDLFGEAASHLSLVSSGASPLVSRTNPELVAAAHTELLEALPAIRSARLTRATVVREPRATFSLAPGQPPRPEAATSIEGLFLAGDWTDTGLPATIESAVRSGHRAATLALGNGLCLR
jgi:hydroxysqualene dehydroxylase